MPWGQVFHFHENGGKFNLSVCASTGTGGRLLSVVCDVRSILSLWRPKVMLQRNIQLGYGPLELELGPVSKLH